MLDLIIEKCVAGSALKLCDAIPNVIRYAGASLGYAITTATANPARLLGLDQGHGFLRVSGLANLVLYRWMGHVACYDRVIAGKVCYQA